MIRVIHFLFSGPLGDWSLPHADRSEIGPCLARTARRSVPASRGPLGMPRPRRRLVFSAKRILHRVREARAISVPALLMAMMLVPAFAEEKTYEKPSAFLTRHFGEVPKTRVLVLTSAQQAGLKKILGHEHEQKSIRYWQNQGKAAWILSELGKTEPITAGFVIKDGAIVETKVLIYRESHGWEVSRPFFTKQFVGARLNGDQRMSREIDGIVGATLSVRALTKLSAAALYLSQQLEP